MFLSDIDNLIMHVTFPEMNRPTVGMRISDRISVNIIKSISDIRSVKKSHIGCALVIRKI